MDLDWFYSALCAQTDPDLFQIEHGGSTQAAKRICQECEVRPPCLAWAMELEAGRHWSSREGVLGGLSTVERGTLDQAGWLPGDVTPLVRFRRGDPGHCEVCGKEFKSIHAHLATKVSCREATQGDAA